NGSRDSFDHGDASCRPRDDDGRWAERQLRTVRACQLRVRMGADLRPRANHLHLGRSQVPDKVGRETFAVESTRPEDWVCTPRADRGSLFMVESNTNGDEPRLVLTGGSGARVVLAEADAPGSLHYLLEGEGFQVVGCASNEDELGRVLGQGVRPDVIVLDADVVATSSLVARQLAPEAHVIAVWPEAVQPPPGGERVDPRMVYEELGPAIRRHMDRRTVPVPVIAMPAEEPVMAGVAAAAAVPMASGSVVARVASRVSVLSATLITAILLTMGVSFALGGFRWHPSDGSPRVVVPRSSDAGRIDPSDPLTGRVPSGAGNGDPGSKPTDHSGGSNGHHGTGGITSVVATTTGGSGDTGSTPGDQTGGSGDQGSGQGDQGGGQGDQGGGQGDQ